MWRWLMQKLQRKPPPPVIRTFEDLQAALKSGAIKPHVSSDGAVQTVDLFAETGLSPTDRKKVMLRSFPHPAGIRMYVHIGCADAYLAQLPARGETTFPESTEEWNPGDLIGRFRDVTHCDQCGREFQPEDEGYVAYWVVSQEELRLLEEVRREPSSQAPRAPSQGGV
jgi:hypothetical protein